MMTTAEALTILRKDAEEERNWRSARAKLTEVLEAATAAHTGLEPVTKQKAALESDVAALRTAFNTLTQNYESYQKQYGQLDQEYRTRKQQLELTLSAVLADLAAAQQLKQETEGQLAALKAKFA